MGVKILNRNVCFVLIQLLLFTVYFFRIDSLDFPVTSWLRNLGMLNSIIGIYLVAAAFFKLGHNLTPFPAPKKNSTLVTSGIYRYFRHPIYSGILFVTIGAGLYTENALRLLVSQFLMLLFFIKAKYEEKLLVEKFPEYKSYQAKTFGIFPFVY